MNTDKQNGDVIRLTSFLKKARNRKQICLNATFCASCETDSRATVACVEVLNYIWRRLAYSGSCCGRGCGESGNSEAEAALVNPRRYGNLACQTADRLRSDGHSAYSTCITHGVGLVHTRYSLNYLTALFQLHGLQ